MKKPNFFIVGHGKSGTRSLYLALRQHPDIFIPFIKHPAYFCKDLHKEEEEFSKRKGKRYLYKNEKDYLELYDKVKNEKAIGDCSEGYIESKIAAKKIKKFNPNAKIIILLREPVDFLRSTYQQAALHSEKADTFKQAIELENKRKKGLLIKSKTNNPSELFYSEKIKYAEKIKRFLNNFSKKNIKIIIFEDFKKNNLKIYKEICEFLEIDENFKPKIPYLNPARKNRFRKLWFVLDSLGIKLARIRKILPDKIWNFGKKIFQKQEKEKIDEQFKKELMKRFKPEVIKINKLLHKENLIDKDKNLIKYWGYDKI